MLSNTMIQVGLYLIALLLLTKPMGLWIAKVMNGESAVVNKLGGPTERLIYRALGIKPENEMGWKHYAVALIFYNVGRRGYLLIRSSFQPSV
jgi:potassium-transporting ATPase potassium-binding subunit